jgi:hypothetical protein
MGAWGTGLYSGDFPVDLRNSVGAVCRLPLAEEALVDALCEAERTAATDPADEDHAIFWLVVADQFEKRGIFSRRVRQMALDIIDHDKDSAMMQALGMKPADLRQRARKLGELRTRLAAQPESSRPRKTLREPQPYVFELHGVYAYPTCVGEPINPYIPAKRFDRAAWRSDGFGLMLVIGRGRAFGYLAWYIAAMAKEVAAAMTDREALVRDLRWAAPPGYGTCNPDHFNKMELVELGVFPVDAARLDHFYPHRATGIVHAASDISIANNLEIRERTPRAAWRRPEGKREVFVYPGPPSRAELM